MDDVASQAGVSRTLVSLVLRGKPGAGAETSKRILRIADELGYRPDSAAQLLARGRSRALGVMMNVDQPFHVDLIKAIYPEAERLGYDVLLSATTPGRDERKAVGALLDHRCEALILLGSSADAAQLERYSAGVPTVLVGRRLAGAMLDSVHTAEGKGVRQAVDYLVELGHRRIVHIDGDRESGSVDRRRAYRTAMRRHKLDEFIRVIPGHHTEDAGIDAGQLLLGEDDLPTAVLAGNDRCAFGLIHSLSRGGVDVPGQVSVVGYDDSHLSHLSQLDLTTVRQDADRIGTYAVRSAVERLEQGGLDSREVVLDSKLVVRGTTGPPRAEH
ncbi:LacI family DNA-binding transcriptional regulator [Glycomyces buryatensis]|uniref:LacI family transcriptional regulator n=1 Tax=Glycomyces buryatensis TaxID=2570927 RepID=A0A4S8QC36_9ACTN|nr:LacI family DNA-binding transcriptional regulator [Glycomyces buryatensis]THV42083.1 LacI family transcriptional regulator [Glycomyces buryatensis]